MDIPRPLKYLLYGFIFFTLITGTYKILSWIGILILIMILYIAFRFMAMDCHHRFTGIPMAVMLLLISLFDIVNITTMIILGVFMAIDIFI